MAKDNLGNELTKEQELYFKNSKVRDSKGNLIVCYHGTINPNFDEFNSSKGNSQFGDYKFGSYNVNYFTRNKETAIGYTEIGVERDNNIYSCYLNIVNPFIVDGNKGNWSNFKDKDIDTVRGEQFEEFVDRWFDNYVDESDLKEINKDLRVFGLVIKSSLDRDKDIEIFKNYSSSEDYYDVYKLSNKIYSKPVIFVSYTLDELFSSDMLEDWKEELGIEEENYYESDDIVRYVIYLNEKQGKDYDGIILKNITDIGPKGNLFSDYTDNYITLKSSNQIKRISNLNPTSSNNINESVKSGIELYHGSQDKDLKIRDDYPLYLTNDLDMAKDFALGYNFNYDLLDNDYPTVYKIKINIKNPYVITTEEEYEDIMDITEYDVTKSRLEKEGYDSIIYLDEEDNINYYLLFDAKNQTEIIDKIKLYKSLDEDNINEKIVLRGRDNFNNRKGINQFGLFFYGDDETDLYLKRDIKDSEYGILDKYEIDDNAKIFEGISSEDYCKKNNLMNKEYDEIDELCKYYDIYNSLDDSEIEYDKIDTIQKLFDIYWEYYDIIDEPNLQFAVTQFVAKQDLENKGYDGVHWENEDDLTPEQYQIWNLDKVNLVNESLNNINEELFGKGIDINDYKDIGIDFREFDSRDMKEIESEIDDRLDESLKESNQPSKEEVLQELDDVFGQSEPYLWSTYILPNGHCLNPDNGEDYWEDVDLEPEYEHSDFYDYEYNPYGQELFDDTCVKINVNDPYISLPNKVTSKQWNMIETILTAFKNGEEKSINQLVDEYCDNAKNMTTPFIFFTDNYQEVIDLDKYDIYDLIKKLKKSLISGVLDLDESLNKKKVNEDFWQKKVSKWVGWDNQEHSKEYKIYNPNMDSKYKRLCKKPINTLTQDEVDYIASVRYCVYMTQMQPFKTPEEALTWYSKNYRDELNSCYEYLHSLSFPLTIYRAIRVGNFKSSEKNPDSNELIISGKQQSYSWTTNINIYKNERSKFKNASDIVSCEIDSNIVDNANTIYNYIHYTANSQYSGYGEYEITLKDNFKQSDLHNLRFVNKEEIQEKYKLLSLSEWLNEDIDENSIHKTGKAYKVFRVKNGKLYPPMVANKDNKDTPIGKWIEAEEGEFAGLSKTGRPQVKQIKGGQTLSYRPGWHLGEIPRASQFDRTNKETGEVEFPKDFVWAECDYIMDIDYQKQSDEQGYMRTKKDEEGNVITTRSDKYQHSLAGLPYLPKNGYYKYRTNPNPNTVPWIITGAIKVNKLLSDEEVNDILKKNGVKPIHRQGGDKTLKELGLQDSLQEKIVKKGNKWQVQSEKGRNMGTYDTKEEAEKRLKQIEYFKHINESLKLDEATRNQMISKSKNADDYSKNNRAKGRNRYERRTKSRIANSVAQYNKISMDEFFKRDILTVGVDVIGETDNYVVTIRMKDVLRALQDEVKRNDDKLEFKCIFKALSYVFTNKDIQTHCNCLDSKYRQNYWLWKNNDGTQYEPRPSNITNPNDTKGAGCKHTMLILSNKDWIMKVASVIFNYIKYAQKNMSYNYATYIFPKVYGVPYKKAIQMSIFDTGFLPQDSKTLTNIASTNLGDKDTKGRWTTGNKYRFTKSNPNSNEDEYKVDDKQIKFGDDVKKELKV